MPLNAVLVEACCGNVFSELWQLAQGEGTKNGTASMPNGLDRCKWMADRAR